MVSECVLLKTTLQVVLAENQKCIGHAIIIPQPPLLKCSEELFQSVKNFNMCSYDPTYENLTYIIVMFRNLCYSSIKSIKLDSNKAVYKIIYFHNNKYYTCIYYTQLYSLQRQEKPHCICNEMVILMMMQLQRPIQRKGMVTLCKLKNHMNYSSTTFIRQQCWKGRAEDSQ